MSVYCSPNELPTDSSHGAVASEAARPTTSCETCPAVVQPESDEWIGYREAMRQFGVKKTHLYGRLAKLVRTRRMPGESIKWSRSDLERLAKKHTTMPSQPAPPQPRVPNVPARRRRPATTGTPIQPQFKYL